MIKNGLKKISANYYVNWVRNFKDMALSSFHKKTSSLDLLPKLPWSNISLKFSKIDIFGYFLLCLKIWVSALNNFLSGVYRCVLDLLPILTKIPPSKCPIFGPFCTPFFECVLIRIVWYCLFWLLSMILEYQQTIFGFLKISSP